MRRCFALLYTESPSVLLPLLLLLLLLLPSSLPCASSARVRESPGNPKTAGKVRSGCALHSDGGGGVGWKEGRREALSYLQVYLSAETETRFGPLAREKRAARPALYSTGVSRGRLAPLANAGIQSERDTVSYSSPISQLIDLACAFALFNPLLTFSHNVLHSRVRSIKNGLESWIVKRTRQIRTEKFREATKFRLGILGEFKQVTWNVSIKIFHGGEFTYFRARAHIFTCRTHTRLGKNTSKSTLYVPLLLLLEYFSVPTNARCPRKDNTHSGTFQLPFSFRSLARDRYGLLFNLRNGARSVASSFVP